MNKIEPGWELYRTLLAVVREGSLSGAARALGLTQPTVGRHIDALEAALGSALFTRSQGGLAPTESTLALVPHAEAMESASAALVRAASGEAEEARGTVRLTASDVIGVEVMPKILASFRETHPQIDVELLLSNRRENLLRRDADIAVRMVRPEQEALIARKIGEIPVLLYAHRLYVERHGLPASIDDIEGHTLIGYDNRPDYVRTQMGDDYPARDNFGIRTDNEIAQLAMVRAGVGIGGAQMQLAMHNPDLVPVMHNTLRFPMEMWLVMHEDLKMSRRVRLLFDHLVEHLSAYAASAGA
ncbi:MAG TPA: LysR family transcriptional regulator [Parvibaculum sp.]|jgi:DNA-binding transcriptional LysR family regulator